MLAHQVELEVLARELGLRELEELLRRPLVGEHRLEHQVERRLAVRQRVLLVAPSVAVRSFHAAAAHRRCPAPAAPLVAVVLQTL